MSEKSTAEDRSFFLAAIAEKTTKVKLEEKTSIFSNGSNSTDVDRISTRNFWSFVTTDSIELPDNERLQIAPLPFTMQVLYTAVWVIYAIEAEQNLVLIINIVGFVFGLIFVALFPKLGNMRMYKTQFKSQIIMCVVVINIAIFLNYILGLVDALSYLAATFSTIMYAYPVPSFLRVLKTKNVQPLGSLAMQLSIFSACFLWAINAAVWLHIPALVVNGICGVVIHGVGLSLRYKFREVRKESIIPDHMVDLSDESSFVNRLIIFLRLMPEALTKTSVISLGADGDIFGNRDTTNLVSGRGSKDSSTAAKFENENRISDASTEAGESSDGRDTEISDPRSTTALSMTDANWVIDGAGRATCLERIEEEEFEGTNDCAVITQVSDQKTDNSSQNQENFEFRVSTTISVNPSNFRKQLPTPQKLFSSADKPKEDSRLSAIQNVAVSNFSAAENSTEHRMSVSHSAAVDSTMEILERSSTNLSSGADIVKSYGNLISDLGRPSVLGRVSEYSVPNIVL